MKGISDVLVAGGFGSVQLKNSSDNYVSHVRSRGGMKVRILRMARLLSGDARKKRRLELSSRRPVCRMPAITDFRARGTIIGLTGLTAVFGMGTGVTPSVCSPTKLYAGVVSTCIQRMFGWLVKY